MAVTKLNEKQWARFIEKGLKKHEYRQNTTSLDKILRTLHKHKAIPIIIGLTACIVYIEIWGFKELFKTVTTYLIVFTILASVVANFINPKK